MYLNFGKFYVAVHSCFLLFCVCLHHLLQFPAIPAPSLQISFCLKMFHFLGCLAKYMPALYMSRFLCLNFFFFPSIFFFRGIDMLRKKNRIRYGLGQYNPSVISFCGRVNVKPIIIIIIIY